jgi:hypothetical protein
VILDTFKELDILLFLVEQLKAGENDAEWFNRKTKEMGWKLY